MFGEGMGRSGKLTPKVGKDVKQHDMVMRRQKLLAKFLFK